MERITYKASGLLVLCMILVPAGLPLRAADEAGAAIERGKQLLMNREYATAERELRRAVDQLRGSTDTQQFAAEANLGVALYGLCRYAEAESVYLRALDLGSGLNMGGTEIAAVKNNLAALYSAQGRLEEAELAANDVLKLATGEGTLERATQANTLITLAGIRQQLGRYHGAEDASRRAVQILTEVGSQTALATALEQLAIARQSQGDLKDTDRLLSRAKEIRESQSGSDDPKLARVYALIGALRLAERRYEESEELLKRAIAIWKQAGVPDAAQYPATLNNLAQLYKATGAYAKADVSYREALEGLEQTVGRKHPTYALFLGNFADLMRSQGRLYAAERLYREAISILETAGAPAHPAIEQFRSGLAGTRARLAAEPAWTVDAGQLSKGFR